MDIGASVCAKPRKRSQVRLNIYGLLLPLAFNHLFSVAIQGARLHIFADAQNKEIGYG
jgi:hypothetical protein